MFKNELLEYWWYDVMDLNPVEKNKFANFNT